jgi:hypothetical protein
MARDTYDKVSLRFGPRFMAIRPPVRYNHLIKNAEMNSFTTKYEKAPKRLFSYHNEKPRKKHPNPERRRQPKHPAVAIHRN